MERSQHVNKWWCLDVISSWSERSFVVIPFLGPEKHRLVDFCAGSLLVIIIFFQSVFSWMPRILRFSHVYVFFSPPFLEMFFSAPFCHYWMNQLRYPKAHGWRSLWRSWVLSRCKSLMALKMAKDTKQNWRISLDRDLPMCKRFMSSGR